MSSHSCNLHPHLHLNLILHELCWWYITHKFSIFIICINLWWQLLSWLLSNLIIFGLLSKSIYLALQHTTWAKVIHKTTSPSSQISSLLWLVSSHTPEPAQLTTTEQLCWINSYMPNLLLCINYANVWHGDLKVRLLVRHFRSSVLCGTKELLMPLFMHVNVYSMCMYVNMYVHHHTNLF